VPDDDYTDRLRTIVVGIDVSDTSQRAARYAVTIARGTGARLIFAHVLNTATLIGLAPAALPGVRDAAMQTGDEIEKRMHDWLDSIDLVWELRRFEGNPYVELCRVAEQEQADTIIVGASMRAAHRLIGSLPVHLVKSHRWPVTVVP
jgi:nucleotide-binding universal stress UspA family protein